MIKKMRDFIVLSACGAMPLVTNVSCDPSGLNVYRDDDDLDYYYVYDPYPYYCDCDPWGCTCW